MGIESKKIRTWLAASTFASIHSEHAPQKAVEEPASYSASFNPFPALVIGITGAAMAAHAQTYMFQVGYFTLFTANIVNSLRFSMAGSNTFTLGKPAPCLRRPPVLHLLLPVARATKIHTPLATTNRGPRKFLPGLRRTCIHVLYGRSYNCSDASRPRWYVAGFSSSLKWYN